MTIRSSFAVWFVYAAVAAAPLNAQPNLERRTAIDVSAADAHDVYRSLARTLGCELSMAQKPLQPVTMKLSDVTVRTALNALSEGVGCRWRLEGNTLVVETNTHSQGGGGVPGGVVGGVPGGVGGGVVGGVPGGVGRGVPGGIKGGGIGGVDFKQRFDRKTPADFRFENVPLRSVLEALGKVADMEVRVDEPAASRLISVDLSNRTVLSALKDLQPYLDKGIVFAAPAPGSEKKMLLKVGPPRKK